MLTLLVCRFILLVLLGGLFFRNLLVSAASFSHVPVAALSRLDCPCQVAVVMTRFQTACGDYYMEQVIHTIHWEGVLESLSNPWSQAALRAKGLTEFNAIMKEVKLQPEVVYTIFRVTSLKQLYGDFRMTARHKSASLFF